MERCRIAFEDRPGAEIEPCAQHRVVEMSARLSERADAVILDHRGPAEAAQLRKDEPHPVTPLPTRSKLAEHGIKNRLLRRHEALEVERLGHLNGSFQVRFAVQIEGASRREAV